MLRSRSLSAPSLVKSSPDFGIFSEKSFDWSKTVLLSENDDSLDNYVIIQKINNCQGGLGKVNRILVSMVTNYFFLDVQSEKKIR